MEICKDCVSAVIPDKIVKGPTCILVHSDPVETTMPGEDETEIQAWKFDTYRFTHSEYDNLKANGALPAGATWDDILRGIERSGMYDWADTMIAKANDYIACGTEEQASAWETYRNELRTWKMAVRNTQTKKGYPKKVTYPGRPTTPE